MDIPVIVPSRLGGQSVSIFIGMFAVIGAGAGVLLGQGLLWPALVGAGLGYLLYLSEMGKGGSFLDKYGGREARLFDRKTITYLSAISLGLIVADQANMSLLAGAGVGAVAGYFILKDTKY